MKSLRQACLALGLTLSLASAAYAQGRSERAESYLRSFHDLHRFNGAALVVDRGEVLFQGAFGFSELGADAPAQASTRFRIASLTKQFTAALILRLEEEGLLRIAAPVSEYIEEYPTPDGDRITLHHLLTHTSGLPSYTDIPGFMESGATTPLAPGEIIGLTWEEPLRFEPGTDFEYSNSGYVLLGWVAERVTGRTYDEALAEYVLDPLGLVDTGYDHHVAPPAGHASGYTRELMDYEPARPLDPSLPFSAGMLYSTVGDLGRWTSALLGWDSTAGPFRDPTSAERMLTPELDSYGYGVGISVRDLGREREVRVIQHSGGIFGFSSVIRAFPDHHRLIVLLDNTSSDLGPIVEGLTNLLWGDEAVVPKPSIAERIVPIIESAGVEAAIERYRDWRRTRPDQYDYDPGQLMMLAGHYRERDPDIAIALLEAQAEEMPESPFTRYALSELYAASGDTTAAVTHVEAALTYNPGMPQLLARLALLGAEPDPALRLPVVGVEEDELGALVGVYRIDPATTLTVTVEDDALVAHRTDEPPFRLLPQSATTFLLHGSRVQLVFDVEGDNAVRVSILEAGQRLTFPRIAGST